MQKKNDYFFGIVDGLHRLTYINQVFNKKEFKNRMNYERSFLYNDCSVSIYMSLKDVDSSLAVLFCKNLSEQVLVRTNDTHKKSAFDIAKDIIADIEIEDTENQINYKILRNLQQYGDESMFYKRLQIATNTFHKHGIKLEKDSAGYHYDAFILNKWRVVIGDSKGQMIPEDSFVLLYSNNAEVN